MVLSDCHQSVYTHNHYLYSRLAVVTYVVTASWGPDDFYYLNRYLARLFLHADRRTDEIRSLDLSRMTRETKVLIYIILLFQKKGSFLEFENLSDLKDTQPLETKLNLVNEPKGVHELYAKFNVGW